MRISPFSLPPRRPNLGRARSRLLTFLLLSSSHLRSLFTSLAPPPLERLQPTRSKLVESRFVVVVFVPRLSLTPSFCRTPRPTRIPLIVLQATCTSHFIASLSVYLVESCPVPNPSLHPQTQALRRAFLSSRSSSRELATLEHDRLPSSTVFLAACFVDYDCRGLQRRSSKTRPRNSKRVLCSPSPLDSRLELAHVVCRQDNQLSLG